MYAKHKTHKAQKIAKRVRECTRSGIDYKTKVARAGSSAGRRVKETGTDND